jgi:hypothetical protein
MKRQGSQDDRAQHSKHCRTRANAKRQRHHSDSSEAAIFSELPLRDAKIME